MNRWMRRCAALSILASFGAAADVVDTRTRDYVVKYKDGAVERYSVKWVLDVATKVRDEGGSIIPYQGNRENLRCSWSVTSTIERSVSLATRLGQTIPLANMSRKIDKDSPQGRELAIAGKHEGGCGSARKERESDFSAATRASREAFERFADADLETLKREAHANPDVLAITVQ